jgi:hypothetical protein
MLPKGTWQLMAAGGSIWQDHQCAAILATGNIEATKEMK